MPLTERKIPNGPLSGTEVAEVAIREARDMMRRVEENALATIRTRLAGDGVFAKNYGHPRVIIEIDIRFHWATVSIPKTVLSFAEACGSPDALIDHPDSEHYVEGVTREIEVSNPNAVRARAGLPVVITESVRPGPQEIIGSLKEYSMPVTGAPEVPVKETDTTEALAKEKRIPPPERRLRRGQ